MVPYRIVLANNHAAFRQCLKQILQGRSEMEVVGEAENASELLRFLSLSKGAPHMVILDLSLPDLTRDIIHKLKTIQPDLKVLTLSMHKDKEYFGRAILNGAEGYLIKETVDKELLPAIDMIMGGRLYVPPFP